MNKRRGNKRRGRAIAVTGLGAITPLGSGRQEVWQGFLSGRSGIGPVESFDTSAYNVHVGAEVKGFDPQPYFRRLESSAVGRASQLAVAAARQALDDADLEDADFEKDGLDPFRCGVAMGTTSGEPLEVEHFNDLRAVAGLAEYGGELMTRYPSHVIAAHIAAELGFAGPNTMIPAACAAGNYAMGHAFEVLSSGRADLMLAGGADAFSRITYTGFARLGAIAPDVCRPFDRQRQGMIPGEGAAVLVLEPLDRARARGAHIYALITGYGLSCDAHHMTAAHPEGSGAVRAMEEALRSSGRRADEVSYVSAHGTGTPTNDRLESRAVARVFGERSSVVPMSSVKSMIGHTMGAASAIEGLVCAMAVADDRIPPTINFQEPDPECAVDCVANQARSLDVQVAMSNAYAFGGNNASVIFEKPSAH